MWRNKIEELFWQLYNCKNEQEVDELIWRRPESFGQSNWYPLGGNTDNIGTVENQQSNPVAALVEKLTNSIDAILMRKCYEAGIAPKSSDAPRTMPDAVELFFPNSNNWDLPTARSNQARSIQVIADGYKNNKSDVSVIIYDDGEGQHPDKFEETFLSIQRGNKKEIHFVQGRYNMGGSGALFFCGAKKYQLIASKRFDGDGNFGFSLVRERPLSEAEEAKYKDTWYEFLKIDGVIPSFDIDEIDLGLQKRSFRTGTVIKLYSYDVQRNQQFQRDLRRSLNEFLYRPALPIAIYESKDRYPTERSEQAQVIFGLERLLANNENIEHPFTLEIKGDRQFGNITINVYVFKVRIDGKSIKESKSFIRREYFKNGMAVLFSVNGQVQGHYRSDFITNTLGFPLLKDNVLIHVDCTCMNRAFRRKLFMASRDRLTQSSKQSVYLREKLKTTLRNSRLRDINKQRRDRLSYDSVEDEDLLKNAAENLPISKDLSLLLKQTYELENKRGKKKRKVPSKPQKPGPQYKPERYPSFFNIVCKSKVGTPVITIPIGGEKSVFFETDAEDEYFDRAEDPGDMNISIMKYSPNDASGGDAKGTVNDVTDPFSVTTTSPKQGKIRIIFEPNEALEVGDAVEIRVDLTSPNAPNGEYLPQLFFIKIVESKPKEPPKTPEEEENLGLPKLRRVFRDLPTNELSAKTWDELDIEMDYDVIMYPVVTGEVLDTIFINMHSNVLMKYKSNLSGIEQNQLADNRYISAVYFHTIFLYVINRQREYSIQKQNGSDSEEQVDLTQYLQDLFASNYAEFLLKFETAALMEGLG